MLNKDISVLLLVFSVLFILFIQRTSGQDLTPSPTPSPTLSPTPTPTPVKVTVNGQPRKSVKLFQGQSISLETPDESIKLSSTNTAVFTITPTENARTRTLTIKSDAPDGTAAQIQARTANEDSLRHIDVAGGVITVTGYKLPTVSTALLKMNEPKKLSEIFNLNDAELLNQLEIDSYKPDEIEYNGNTLVGKKTQSNSSITYRAKGTTTLDKTATFQIESNINRIEISSTNKSLIAYAGSTFSLFAKAKDDSGAVNSALTEKIQWSVAEGKKDGTTGNKPSESVVLMPKGTGEIDIYVLNAYKDPITITAKISGDELSKSSYSFFAKGEQNIVGFSNIEMRLNLMDERTAKDLFGGVAVDDYMIAKLRIFNKVPEDQNGGPASSILFFSEGLEVNVSLEKRYQERTKNSPQNEWKQLNLEDIEYINNWVYIKNVDEELSNFFITRTEKECTDSLKRLLGNNSCQISAAELDRLWYFYEKNNCTTARDEEYKDNGFIDLPARCSTVARKNWIPFRPYAFLLIASTHDRRAERSTRERILKAANSLSSLASFATAFAKPTGGGDFVFGLDKYSNLLVPSFEKLFPSRREIQRKNILDMTLQPVEEVPFGKEITKVVFIPKQTIEGILPGYDVRITTVSVSKIKAEASVVQKQKIENR